MPCRAPVASTMGGSPFLPQARPAGRSERIWAASPNRYQSLVLRHCLDFRLFFLEPFLYEGGVQEPAWLAGRPSHPAGIAPAISISRSAPRQSFERPLRGFRHLARALPRAQPPASCDQVSAHHLFSCQHGIIRDSPRQEKCALIYELLNSVLLTFIGGGIPARRKLWLKAAKMTAPVIWSVVSDAQWDQVAPRLPGKPGDPGRSASDNRQLLEAVLWIARVGTPWRDFPDQFRNWHSAFKPSGARAAA